MARSPEGVRGAAGWVFEPQAARESPSREPLTLRHPEPPGLWRLRFDPPLAAEWLALDWGCGGAGVVDARLVLILDDGSRLTQPLAKTARNQTRAMVRPPRPLIGIEVVLAGSVPPEAWPEPVLRRVPAGERRRALVRRGLAILAGDPRSLPWRAARVLIQWRRQGRGTIPLTTSVTSEEEAYAVWRERFDEREEDRTFHETRLAGLTWRPRFILLADPEVPPPEAEALAASLKAQVYGDWTLWVPHAPAGDVRIRPMPEGASRAARLDAALALAEGDFVFLPAPGTRPRPHALLVFALTVQRCPGARLVYADDDDDGPAGRLNPRFKPAWSPLRAEGGDYVGDLRCFDAALFKSLGSPIEAEGPAQRHDLLLRATAGCSARGVVHVAQVLSHKARTAAPVEARRPPAQRPAAPPWGSGAAPLVSIIIPTHDHADLLRMSVGSIRDRTRYPAYEIIVVDNGSREPETLRLFESWGGDASIRVLRDPRPFNYSSLNNFAAAEAKGSLLALLNNDVEVVEPLWLAEMAALAARPGIGCVGAKLHYPDGRLQHGGVVTGVGGAAGHRHKRAARGAPGLLDCLVTTNEVSAVTGACLVVSKAVYDALGGLDAEAFAVGYNDVDFCLRAAAAGYRNVWTPFAELNHYESVSRGRDLSPRTMARFNREVLALRLRWGDRLIDDPYSSPNLTLDSEQGGIRTQ